MEYGEFYTFVKGTTAREAFNKAKEEAIAKYGNNSHSCSVLQKEEFKEFPADITVINDMCESKINSIAGKERTAESREEIIELREKKSRLKKEKSHFKNRSKRTGKDKATAIAHFIIEIEPEEINAPEKPAGIVQALKNEWLVFGLANE